MIDEDLPCNETIEDKPHLVSHHFQMSTCLNEGCDLAHFDFYNEKGELLCHAALSRRQLMEAAFFLTQDGPGMGEGLHS